jgi:SAM-dependent methyltransferase
MRVRRGGQSSDEAFVAELYERLLGRAPDAAGAAEYARQLAAGSDRGEIALAIATSDEHREFVLRSHSPRRRDPTHYRLAVSSGGTDACWVFDVTDDTDFDHLESTIINDGYYEAPGVWSLEVDDDKRVMADLIARFAPRRALEIGCASGAVLRALLDLGVVADGVDISHMARDRAPDEVREHVHVGDLIDGDLGGLADNYDLVFGLDIFEHLNPNRLARYLDALRARVVDGGWLFTVVPAFGTDDVFGEVFPLYLRDWDADVAANRPFRTLHTDDDGYPMNGHLIWATTQWWVEQFARAGFVRRPEIERAIQTRYHAHFEAEPARRSCYVFTAGAALVDAAAVLDRLRIGES